MEVLLEAGTLSERILRQSRRSLENGEREPLATELHEVADGGEVFAVRVAVGRDRKWSTTLAQRAAGVDPFLPPYEGELFVADVTDMHAALLNKFNAVDGHLLIVTRTFADQQDALDDADFTALWLCMHDVDGLGFYNSGPEAGASQPHKHLQLVEWSALYAGTSRRATAGLPVGAKPAEGAPRYAFSSAPVPALPDAPAAAGARLAALYRTLLGGAGLAEGGAPAAPYNLLLTRERMIVIPRTRSGWHRCGVNGMGYAGSLLLHHAEDLAWLREVGPCALLARVGRAEPGAGGAS